MKQGLFVVLYGINNLGKSTQAKKLVDRLNEAGHDAVYLKYPIYDLYPSGTMLNAYLREGNPFQLSAREGQTLYALNRTQYEPSLKELLGSGTHVIAEDYTGTGIAWGVGAGVDRAYLDLTNDHLLREDLSFWFDGERYTEATESGHKHETNNDLLELVRYAHQQLAHEHGWIHINANESIDAIHQQLWDHLIQKLESASE